MGHKGAREDLTYERAHEVFSYDPETGMFRWKIVSSNRRMRPGDKAGCLRPNGRVAIQCDGSPYLAHRLAWLMMTGTWPEFEIDHKDLNPANNRWENLREATRAQNMSNIPLRVHNKSGHTGVSWDASRGKWRAKINNQMLGTFNSIEDAIAARRQAEPKIHGEFAHHALTSSIRVY